MIELERVNSLANDFPGEVWSDESNDHVIVQETPETAPISSPGPGWYVRDSYHEEGPFSTFAQALDGARRAWAWEVELAPANRLRAAVEVEDENDVGTYLLEYLSEYGAVGIDARALALRVFERIEEA